MADHTINIDVFDLTVPELNPINIAIINLPNPVKGYSANAEEVKSLIQIPRYTVFESGTSNVISGKNYFDYFPEENPGGGGGGGSCATVDTAMSDSSTNAVQNKVIKGYVDGITGDINTVLEGVL